MAVTRRARKHSPLSIVVVEWSRTRKRYERQGVLVESAAIAKAMEECQADAVVRGLRQERAAERRALLDQQYIAEFAERIRQLYPGCPAGEEERIAHFACEKYSGRVGRSAMAKRLDAEAVFLAVQAHVRHEHTNYDTLLMKSWDRGSARFEVQEKVDSVIQRWSKTRRK
jgi:hypothetical protein